MTTNDIALTTSTDVVGEQEAKQFVSMEVDGQLFGIPVLTVHDVLRPQLITKAPLAPPEVMGSINLRGRIVSVINMRTKLGIAAADEKAKTMHVVVEYKDDLYSLVVDGVGEVLNLPLSKFEKTPANLSSVWRHVSLGVYRLKERLLVVLDIDNLLNIENEE